MLGAEYTFWHRTILRGRFRFRWHLMLLQTDAQTLTHRSPEFRSRTPTLTGPTKVAGVRGKSRGAHHRPELAEVPVGTKPHRRYQTAGLCCELALWNRGRTARHGKIGTLVASVLAGISGSVFMSLQHRGPRKNLKPMRWIQQSVTGNLNTWPPWEQTYARNYRHKFKEVKPKTCRFQAEGLAKIANFFSPFTGRHISACSCMFASWLVLTWLKLASVRLGVKEELQLH